MSIRGIPTPGCGGCPDNLYFWNDTPQKYPGTMLQPGEHYCTGGKKPRRFRSKDPKRKVPSWCPRRKNPCELRVYGFKSNRDRALHTLFDRDDSCQHGPQERRYAVVRETHTDLTPAEFWKRIKNECVEDLLRVEVQLNWVIEIDDGLKPVCFYRTEDGYIIVPYFDTAAARKNELEETSDHPASPDS